MKAKDVSQALAREAIRVADYLLPQGKKAGREWKVGSVAGEPGDSLSVRVAGDKAGVWSDFSTGEAGDLIDLWMAVRNLSLAEAIAEAKGLLGVHDDMPERERKVFTKPAKPKGRAAATTESRVLAWLQGRGLTQETVAAFRVVEQTRGEAVYALFPYLSEDGDYLNGKARNIDNKKDMRQEPGAMPCLFGWPLLDRKSRTVIIAEGELDAMTLHQAGLPALSVNAGAGNHQWIENDFDRLARFDDIVVCFDNDEAGEKGAREVMQRLGLERCRRMTFPGAKDANEYLQGGAEPVDFHDAFKAAKAQDPEELRSAADYLGQVSALFYPLHDAPRDPPLFIDKALEWFEFRGGEVTVWTGINGHGKSLLLQHVQIGLMAAGANFVVFSGEMKPARLLKRAMKQASGMDRPSQAYLRAMAEWMREKYWLFDVLGTAKLDRLLEVFLHARRRYGCTHFVIDSLMMTDVPEDGPGAMTAQKEAMRKLCAFARGQGVHLHLVAHPRKARDESQAPNKMDVAGSSKITDGADNVFSVWRAQKDQAQTDDGSCDAKLELQKQRNGEVQNYTQLLWFDRESMQYRTQERRYPLSFVPYSSQEANP